MLSHSQNHEAVKAMQKLYNEALESIEGSTQKKAEYESVVSVYEYDFTKNSKRPIRLKENSKDAITK